MTKKLPNYNKEVGGYVVFNENGKTAITNDGTKGGYFHGDSHKDPSEGISAIVDNKTPILVEGNEVIINKKTVQSDKVLTVKGTPKEILSTLNQMDGNGVAIGDEDAEILAKYREGGEIPEQGTLYTKNRKTKLEYTKNGSDYVFSIFEAEENPVEGYKRNQYKKHDKNKATMNYNQFVNYLYAESFLHDKFAVGGSIGDMTPSELKAFYNTPEGRKLDAETYAEWKSLVNMSKSEITNFYNSPEGKQAGLSESEAKEQGIDSGRESARWIMKMKDIPYKLWSSDMWRWAKKQISFIKRMSGMKGDLYDDKGRKTRKHTALLIWGHKPTKKFEGGGGVGDEVDDSYNKAVKDFEKAGFDVRESSDSKTDFGHSRYFYVNYKNRSSDNLGSGLKVRVSDHGVTNQFRMAEELHIIPSMYSFTVKLAIIDAKIKLMHELFNRERGLNLIPYEKEVRQSNLKDSDIIISERFGSGKRVPITEKVYTVKRFREQPIIKYIDKETGEVVKTFNDELKRFRGGGELSKGTAHEMEHLATLKKVAEGKATPEEAVVETAKTHIAENPEYYEDLAKMESENKKYDWDFEFTSGDLKGQKFSNQIIESIEVYNDSYYTLIFKSGGIFNAKTSEMIGLLSITDNVVKLAVILDENDVIYTQKIKRRVQSFVEKSNRFIVNNNSNNRIDKRQYPYLLVSEKDVENYDLATIFYDKLETPRKAFVKNIQEKHSKFLEEEKQQKEQDLAKMESENKVSMDFDFSSLFEPSESVNDADNDLILSEEQKKEEAYQKSSFDKKWASTRKEAIEKLLKQYFEAENSYKDWSSRQYKQNKSAVFLGGDDIYGQSKSIGAINEGRKQKALKRAESLMKESITDLKEIGLSVSEIDNLIKKDKQAVEEESILETQVRGLELLVPMLEGEQKNIIEKQIRGLKLLINIV